LEQFSHEIGSDQQRSVRISGQMGGYTRCDGFGVYEADYSGIVDYPLATREKDSSNQY
jgi:hypothetical protein